MRHTKALGTCTLRGVIWLIALWGLIMLPRHSAAQAPASTAPTQLPPVEVRGQRLGVEQVVRETSTFATVVDTSEATSKVSSVADVLSESVGVQVRRFGGLGAFSTVSIRGSTPNQVEVYLDNVLQNPANAGLVDLGSLPLDNVERIFVNANKVYVSRLGSPKLFILNPTTLQSLGELDLSRLIKPNNRDGSPEPAYMLIGNGLVYVALQHIDFTQSLLPKVANGEVVVINTTTDSIATVITLNGKNSVSELLFSPTLNRILVSSTGNCGAIDGGGIEAINPDTNTVDAQFAVSEATLGGDLTAFVIVSRIKGFAVVTDVKCAHSLVTFNPSTGRRLNTIVGPLNVFLPHLAINSRNEIYLAVADVRTPTPGLRIFDALTDRELTAVPLNVGRLPPVWTLFIE